MRTLSELGQGEGGCVAKEPPSVLRALGFKQGAWLYVEKRVADRIQVVFSDYHLASITSKAAGGVLIAD